MFDHLRLAPFHLDDAGVAWVRAELARLTPEERVGQLFVHISMGSDPGEVARLARLQPAGVTRFHGPDLQAEVGFLTRAQEAVRLPMFVTADLEGSRMSLPFGTEVPNPLALAAVDDVAATTAISRIMAEEAKAIGINWSFTPVIDINAAFRSPIVATRGFGSDVARIERHALAQIAAFQAEGVAATVKHWPGEGHDDRDQHLVTTINPLSLEAWEATHGRLYRAAIAQGVMAVMSAHIAFPAFAAAMGAEGVEQYRPASVSRHLNEGLLRQRLGFNGIIVSDATPMAGFGAWGPRAEMLPEVIENGCDIILFSDDPEGDHALIARAVAEGRISAARHEAALVRVLGMKAALGLHRGVPELRPEALGRPEARAVARAVTGRAPTLVKDVQGVLPLSPARTKRVLVVSGGIVSPLHPLPFAFDLPQLLAREGFDVALHEPGKWIDPGGCDLVLYLFGEETLLTRGRVFLDWAKVMGGFGPAMQRVWHEVPVVMVSFGYPYLLYDAPRVPCMVNAYATMPSMQAAVLDCLMGRAAWNMDSPVDPFCGLPDAVF
jgi:beta-N-acetylhexosaminidase